MSERLSRVIVFLLGVIVGAYLVFGMQRPQISREQLLDNRCPRVEGGSMWCAGPGFPPP